MNDENLYGRKNPGPWTSALNNVSEQVWNEVTLDDENSYAEGFMNSVENVTTAGVGAGVFTGRAASNGGKKVVNSSINGVRDYNDWAQGLSDTETGIYPYTRDRDRKFNYEGRKRK